MKLTLTRNGRTATWENGLLSGDSTVVRRINTAVRSHGDRQVRLTVTGPEFTPSLLVPEGVAAAGVVAKVNVSGIDFGSGCIVDGRPRSADLAKHMGPGPHPSGSPQSVHRGGMSVGTQSTLDNDPHPHPVTDLTFRRAEDADFVSGTRYRPASADFSPEAISSIKLAVEEFESAYPGLLPPDLTFAYYRSPSDSTAAWVWASKAVRRYEGDPSIVFVNEYFFNDPSYLVQILEEFDAHTISTTGDLTPDAIRTRLIFHELTHIVENHVDAKLRPTDPSWMDLLPFYNRPWYKNQLSMDSPLLPSPYAADSKSEFLAEALSDVWYNKSDASPMSKFAVAQFELLAAGEFDRAERRAQRWFKENA